MFHGLVSVCVSSPVAGWDERKKEESLVAGAAAGERAMRCGGGASLSLCPLSRTATLSDAHTHTTQHRTLNKQAKKTPPSADQSSSFRQSFSSLRSPRIGAHRGKARAPGAAITAATN